MAVTACKVCLRIAQAGASTNSFAHIKARGERRSCIPACPSLRGWCAAADGVAVTRPNRPSADLTNTALQRHAFQEGRLIGPTDQSITSRLRRRSGQSQSAAMWTTASSRGPDNAAAAYDSAQMRGRRELHTRIGVCRRPGLQRDGALSMPARPAFGPPRFEQTQGTT